MKDEFAAYGLSEGSMRVIGGLKLVLAASLIAGIWIPPLVAPAALGLSALMLGAVAMHVRVKDEAIRSLPALCMLCMSVGVVFLARRTRKGQAPVRASGATQLRRHQSKSAARRGQHGVRVHFSGSPGHTDASRDVAHAVLGEVSDAPLRGMTREDHEVLLG